MEPLALLPYVLVAALVAAVGFAGWAATSDSRSARVYRRRWKEFKLRHKSRNTSKRGPRVPVLPVNGSAHGRVARRRYQGTAAGSGSSARDRRIG